MKKLFLLCIISAVFLSSCGVIVNAPSYDGSESATVAITKPGSFLPKYNIKIFKHYSSYYIELEYFATSSQRNSMSVKDGDAVAFRFRDGNGGKLYVQGNRAGMRLSDDYTKFILQIPVTPEILQIFLSAPLYSIEWINYDSYTELEVPINRGIKFAEVVSDYVFHKKLSNSIIKNKFECEQHTIVRESVWDY